MTTQIGGLIHRPLPPAFASKRSHLKHPNKPSLPAKTRPVFTESQSHPVIQWIKMSLGLIRDGHVEKWQAKHPKKPTET